MSTRWHTVVSALLLFATVGAMDAHAASTYATPAIQRQWEQGEKAQANFWGPLATARTGQMEAYKEATGGQRTVQYFDKARMEQLSSTAPVTSGLLTIELKTGQMQTGDATFEKRDPAKVNIAGDAGANGPTYADLAQLPDRVAASNDTPAGYFYANGQFRPLSIDDEKQFADAFNPPSGPALNYYRDPSGRYGQIIYQPFLDFINAQPLTIDQTTGFPISPLFLATVNVGGKPTLVLVQAFERRVLTFNPNNPPAYRVEFGNIGQHYYTWRYGA